jgi:hypothetical protein
MNVEGVSNELVERVAEISHATWMLQAVRDQGRALADLTPPLIPEQLDLTRPDVQEAERILAAVRDDGVSLSDLSANPGHHVTGHDRERARNTVEGLKRLGLLPG